MLANVRGIEVKHDFCFLGNPYATELFLKWWEKDFSKGNNLHSLVERYPSQNPALAEKLENLTGVSARNIFVGNGATEVIQAVLHSFARKKILVPVPTFSPYLEFAPKGVAILQHQLQKEKQFKLNVPRLLSDIQKRKPDTVVIINPNNPDGGYTSATKMLSLLKALPHVKTVIVDESFIHFAQDADKRGYRNADARRLDFKRLGVGHLVREFPNLVVIKSLSKDFGIAGLRLGYGVMSESRVSTLLKKGYLWNVSGFGEYFLDLLNDKAFLRPYEQARLLAIRERDDFFAKLSKIRGLKVYPSKANLFLVELLDGSTANNLMVRLLVKHGIYIRSCGDKVGLKGEFVRIASRKKEENTKIVKALGHLLSE